MDALVLSEYHHTTYLKEKEHTFDGEMAYCKKIPLRNRDLLLIELFDGLFEKKVDKPGKMQ